MKCPYSSLFILGVSRSHSETAKSLSFPCASETTKEFHIKFTVFFSLKNAITMISLAPIQRDVKIFFRRIYFILLQGNTEHCRDSLPLRNVWKLRL